MLGRKRKCWFQRSRLKDLFRPFDRSVISAAVGVVWSWWLILVSTCRCDCFFFFIIFLLFFFFAFIIWVLLLLLGFFRCFYRCYRPVRIRFYITWSILILTYVTMKQNRGDYWLIMFMLYPMIAYLSTRSESQSIIRDTELGATSISVIKRSN